MQEQFKAKGFIEVYRVRENVRSLVFAKEQTIDTVLYTTLRNKLNAYDSAGRGAGIDGITWGSMDGRSGTMVDGTCVGTWAAAAGGTGGNMIRSTPSTQQVKVSGTFTFLTTKNMKYFELGQGYVAAAAGVTSMVTTRYAYDNSILTGSTSLTYLNGESLIVDWTLQIGA